MIQLRLAVRDDLELMMAWRSNPLIYQGFYQQKKPLKWGEHISWFHSRNQDWRALIILFDERKIGVITIGQLDHWNPEIGYYIGEVSLWGQGIGGLAVAEGIKWIKEYSQTHRHITHVHTTVLKTNKRSLNLLKSLGFVILSDARKGEVWLTKKL